MISITHLTADTLGSLVVFGLFFIVLIVDSHAHLSLPDFDEDRDDIIRAAFRNGIEAILCPAEIADPKSVQTTCALTETYPNIFAAGGVHPHHASAFGEDSIKEIIRLADEKKIKAVGEIGLDFHYNYSSPEQQKTAFRAQLNAAEKRGLPVIIHSREAAQDIFNTIREEHYTRGGVIHCFTEDWAFAKKMLDLNFFISFSGIVTYAKSHDLREIARKIPMGTLLVETDAPYLVPHPLRDKVRRNEPKLVKETASFLSQMRELSYEEFSEQINANFSSLFGIEI